MDKLCSSQEDVSLVPYDLQTCTKRHVFVFSHNRNRTVAGNRPYKKQPDSSFELLTLGNIDFDDIKHRSGVT